jgi:hypothetical protein
MRKNMSLHNEIYDQYGRFESPINGRNNMSHHNELLEQFSEYEHNHNKFAEKGNKAAGTRARKALSEITKLAKSQRKVIQEVKNAT